MKLFCKKVMFYITMTIVLLFLMSVDSLNENGYLTISVFIVIITIVICTTCITKEDWDQMF
mgnify:CR=1 FL=1